MSTSMKRREFLKTLGPGASMLALSGESNAGAGLPEKPNILFFFPDQLRFDWTGLNPGLPLRTPHLNALARRGVSFANAVCPSPLCAPCRASLASGKEYDRCNVPDNFTYNYPLEQTTLYTLLRQSGYHVLGCGKFDLRKKAKDWGRDGRHCVRDVCYLELLGFSDGIDNSGKWDGYTAYLEGNVCPYYAFLEEKGLAQVHIDDFSDRRGKNYANTDPTPLPDEAYADNWIAQNGLELIKKVPKGKPWFLQVNFNGPHEPVDITKRMKDRWRDVDFPQPDGSTQFTPDQHVRIRQNYAAMIENIDNWLGIYVDELKKRGEFDTTVIVFSSDHGEMLGDHNRFGKSVPFMPSAGVPLVIGGPGIRNGSVLGAPVSTLDLTATFLDYSSVRVPADMDSRSMRPLLEGRVDSLREVVRSGLGLWRMAFDGRYALIRGYDPAVKYNPGDPPRSEPVLLYDLKEDPLENVDIAAEQSEIVARLTASLER